MDGVINIYKEKGYTSHDVVARLRGILKQKKIGHTGTLDPEAEGVLPICIGKATKLCEYLTDKTKEYHAVMELGITTDTQDMQGNILTMQDVSLSDEVIIEAIKSFIGCYDQIPPMYSAIKVHGRKLYELAREGIEIERAPRRVEILDIKNIKTYKNNENYLDEHGLLCNINNICVSFDCICSKGTYIRTLCFDIGNKLQVGACMKSLVRTRVSNFEIKEAKRLSEIEQMKDEGTLESVLIPTDKCLNYPSISVNEIGEKALLNGNACMLKEVNLTNNCELVDGMKFLFYSTAGEFKAIYKYDSSKKMFIVHKMFL